MFKKLLKSDFDKIFSIMETSFPRDEYRTYDAQKALFDNNAYAVYGLTDDESDAIKAFISVWNFNKIAFIEHFAVNPKYRNGGIGSKLLNDIIKLLGKTVCLEVELPENELACRRIGFYQRNNFFLNKYPYMQPPLIDGAKEIPLFIMTLGDYIDKDTFDWLKNLLYTEVYQCK